MTRFVRVARTADIPNAGGLPVEVDGRRIGLFRVEGDIFAIDDTCSHAQASLCEGMVSGCEVACPLHLATFDLRTGEATGAPVHEPVGTYPVRIVDEHVEIEL